MQCDAMQCKAWMYAWTYLSMWVADTYIYPYLHPNMVGQTWSIIGRRPHGWCIPSATTIRRFFGAELMVVLGQSFQRIFPNILLDCFAFLVVNNVYIYIYICTHIYIYIYICIYIYIIHQKMNDKTYQSAGVWQADTSCDPVVWRRHRRRPNLQTILALKNSTVMYPRTALYWVPKLNSQWLSFREPNTNHQLGFINPRFTLESM